MKKKNKNKKFRFYIYKIGCAERIKEKNHVEATAN